MAASYSKGDLLVFQIESGYGLLRILDVSERGGECIWHITAYADLFIDVETAERAAGVPASLKVAIAHEVLTDRAFESTQTALIAAAPITEDEQILVDLWNGDPAKVPSDRSVRLLLGLR